LIKLLIIEAVGSMDLLSLILSFLLLPDKEDFASHRIYNRYEY